jgi:hypothetical protein
MAAILDAGTYRARATEATLGITQGGKEQVAVRFALEPGLAQASIVWWGYFTEKTTVPTFKALRAAGWKGTDLADLSDLASPNTPEVELVIVHEANEAGEMRARVRWVNDAGGVALAAIDPNKAKVFAAKMRGALAVFDKEAGTPAPTKRPPPPRAPAVPQEVIDAQENQHSTDDIPF